MKLRIDQLANQLKNGLAPVYILSGDEPLQIAEGGDLIRKAARQAGFTERHVFYADNQMNWGDFANTANSLSLFAERQIIELQMPSGKPGDAGAKALLAYITQPNPDNLLIICSGRLEFATQKSKWFTALESAGVFVQIWPVEGHRLPQWLQGRLKRDGYFATPEALQLIAERVDGNLLAADQELEKLKLLAEGKQITEDTVRNTVADHARYDIFQLIDAALLGNIKLCVRIFGVLKGEGTENVLMLWALMREIRLLNQVQQSLMQGDPINKALDNAAKVIGFSPALLKRKQPAIQSALQRHTPQAIKQMLRMGTKLDQAIKGLDSANPWDALLTLTLFLAGLPPIAEI